MSSKTRWSITTGSAKFAQADAGGDAGAAGAADPNPEDIGEDLPDNFATRLGTLAILNYIQEKLSKEANDYGLPPAQFQPVLTTALENYANQNKLKDAQFLAAISGAIGNPKAVRAMEATFIAIFTNLAETYNKQQVAQQQPIAVQYCNEPTDGTYNGGRGTGTQLWTQLGMKFETMFKTMVQNLKATQSTQDSPYAAQAPQQPAPGSTPAYASRTKTAQAVQTEQGPLSTGRYESVDELKADLVNMGPKPETYERFMTLVGPEREDDAKSALASFFQGMSASLYVLYEMLVGLGLASPIDTSIVENLMSQHPELSEGQGHQHHPEPATASDGKPTKIAGLFLPPADSGVNTKADHLEKTAGGSVGGAGSGYPAYMGYGAGENRMCPKIRQPVSTFICRYHCLDGLNIDDHQTLCGEAIWRQAVMDKFSREYRDKDGNWVGGYLNKRFETHYDDGGHPALLKPGERNAPIHEDAWSMEKRLQEMRRTESNARGYSETPGDGPKDLYNFDQHDINKGPKNPQLTEKKKDPIAKLAESDSMFETKTAVEKKKPWTVIPQKPGFEPSKKDLKDVGVKPPKEKKEPWPPKKTPFDGDEKKASFNLSAKRGKKKEVEKGKSGKDYDPNPWAVCHTTVDKDSNPEKYERCVHDVKKKQASIKLAETYWNCEHDQFGTGHVKQLKAGKAYVVWQNREIPSNWIPTIELKDTSVEHVPYPQGQHGPIEAAKAGMTKKAWGLDMSDAAGGGDKMNGMGNNVNHGPVGKKCPTCGKIFAANIKMCDNPNHPPTPLGNPNANYNQGDAERATGAVNNTGMIPIASVENAEVKVANGIYRAAKDGFAAYGDDAQQAMTKLAQVMRSPNQGLAHTHPMDIDSEADRLMNFRQDLKESPMAAPNPNPVAPDNAVAQPAPAPQAPIVPPAAVQPKIVMDEAVPVNQTSPVPAESQGPSEFFPPEVVGPEGWKLPGEEPGPNEGHVSAQDLDKNIQETKASMHPDEHKAVVEQAISSGAHPTQGE